jgi:hypothetical protein
MHNARGAKPGAIFLEGAHDNLAALDSGDKFDDLAEIEQARCANR